MSASPDISIVIPCYNEGEHFDHSIQRLISEANSLNRSYEIILVDDFSEDNTRDLITTICKQYPNCKFIFNNANMGRGRTFMNGVEVARGRIVGFLDIDMEVSCSYLPMVISAIEEGNDVAIVNRNYSIAPNISFIVRAFLSSSYKKIVSAMLHIPVMDTETGFKFFNREKLLKIMYKTQNPHWFWDTEIMAIAYINGYKIKQVDGLFVRNKNKTSTVKLWRDTFNYFKELIRFRKKLRNAKSDLLAS